MDLREKLLFDNPTTRLPVCLVLDTSGSMYGTPIAELNEGIHLFFKDVLEDDVARYSAEIAIVTFGRGGVHKIVDFDSIENQSIPVLEADGLTPMGEAVNAGLDLLEQRKKEYSNAGVEYFQPWLVIMTDGIPTDDIEDSANRTSDLVKNKKLTIFPVGIGDNFDPTVLARFSPLFAPQKLRGYEFKKFFKWLSKSVSRTSTSMPGEKITLPQRDWNEVSL